MGAKDRKTNSDKTPLHSLESQKHQYKDASEGMKAIESLRRMICHWIVLKILRDGPLENLWGGRAKYKKKYSRKGKLNEKKFMHVN